MIAKGPRSAAVRNINGRRYVGVTSTSSKLYARKVAEAVRTRTNRNARVISNSKGFRIYVGPNKATYNARFKIGPTEIWDISEPHTQIPHPNPTDLLDSKGNPVFYKMFIPMGHTWNGKVKAKVMMTPNDFLQLAYDPPRDYRHDVILGPMRRMMENGTPIFTPALTVAQADDPRYTGVIEDNGGLANDFRVSGHEGRHRSQTLVDMGYGDFLIPVEITPGGDLEWKLEEKSKSDSPKVVSKEFEESLLGRIIYPETQSGTVSHPDFFREEVWETASGPPVIKMRDKPFERKSEPFTVNKLDRDWSASTRTHYLEEGA